MNIVEKIFQAADRHAVALICGDDEISYGRLIEMADAAAVRISRCDAARVGLDCPNGVAYVALALAIVRAGKCLVPLAGELTPCERERVIRETKIGAIVDASGAVSPVPSEKWRRSLKDHEAHTMAPSLQDAGAAFPPNSDTSVGQYAGAPPEESFDERALEALNPAFIRFSSGTTGKSKGVVISHERLLERVTAANRGLKITPADRVVWILPMAHHFAVSIMLYLLHGAATIIANSHFAEDVLRVARRHRGTVVYGAPFHHALLAAEASGLNWPELRLAVSTAAALPVATARGFYARYGLPLSQALGVIEVGLPLLNLDAACGKPSAVGRPLPDYQAELREGGELFLKGPGMFDAYLLPWEPASQALHDGWFRTGDIAEVDADGDFHLLGRSHSVINVAGLKCFPEEIEAVLNEAPGVAASRVTGKSNPRFGAVPIAEIVPCDPAEPPKTSVLAAHCREALSRYKVPVEFRFVSSVPRTANGKIQR